MTEAHLLMLEKVLEKRGYHKYIPNNCNGTDLRRVCTNESFHWYKTIKKVREENEDGELRTTFAVILYIPVWDHYQYVNPDDLLSRYGASIVVHACDYPYYSEFRFPFVQEDDHSFFFEFLPEKNKGERYIPKIISQEEINKLIDSWEELANESGNFYQEKCLPLLYTPIRKTSSSPNR